MARKHRQCTCINARDAEDASSQEEPLRTHVERLHPPRRDQLASLSRTQVLLPADRVFTLLESESLIEPMPGDAKAVFAPKNGGVEVVFEKVVFAYPTMLEHKASHNIVA